MMPESTITFAVICCVSLASFVSWRRRRAGYGEREYGGAAIAYLLFAGSYLSFLLAYLDQRLNFVFILLGYEMSIGAVLSLWLFIAGLSPGHARFLTFARRHAAVTAGLLLMIFSIYYGIAGRQDSFAQLLAVTSGSFLLPYSIWAAVIFFRCGREVFLPANALRSYLLSIGLVGITASAVLELWNLFSPAGSFGGDVEGYAYLIGGFLLASGVLMPVGLERPINAFWERLYWARYAYEDIHNVLAAINDRLPLILPRRDALALQLTRDLCDLLDLPPGERNQTVEAATISTFQSSVQLEDGELVAGRDTELQWEYLSPAAALRSDVFFYSRVGRTLSQVDQPYGGGQGFSMRGEMLSRGSRILRVVRYYVEHREDPHVIEQLIRGKGRDFDPLVVDSLRDLLGLRSDQAKSETTDQSIRMFS